MTTFRSVPPPPSPSPQPHRAALDAGAGALANDDSAREWPVAAALDDEPEYWSLVSDADGSFAYLPDLGYLRSHCFTYHCTEPEHCRCGTAALAV